MAGTRSSARNAASSPKGNDKKTPSKAAAGTKRKADAGSSPETKRGKKATPRKEQKTLEETMPQEEEDQPQDIEMKDAADEGEGTDKKAEAPRNTSEARGPSCWFWADQEIYPSAASYANGSKDDDANANADGELAKKNGNGSEKADQDPEPEPNHTNGHTGEATKTAEPKDGAIEKASDNRVDAMPSNVLEKGIIYFFTRGRVGIEDPDSVQDLQRTYIVLRPIPLDAKLGDGPIEDLKNNRLIALPKKVLPKSGQDKFMVFVEKANTTIEDLKQNFMQGSDYDTKTTGTRHTPAVAPIGEGIYAITESAGKTTHLAYMMTIPKELGEVQQDMGICEKGSFVTSLKNPTVSGPANTNLPKGAEFTQEILDDFRGRGWMELRPEHLNYENAQFLLIGEGQDEFKAAVEATSKDQKHDKETPQEEMEKLEHEDELRVEHLRGKYLSTFGRDSTLGANCFPTGDDSIFSDLGISKNDYPDVMTTW